MCDATPCPCEACKQRRGESIPNTTPTSQFSPGCDCSFLNKQSPCSYPTDDNIGRMNQCFEDDNTTAMTPYGRGGVGVTDFGTNAMLPYGGVGTNAMLPYGTVDNDTNALTRFGMGGAGAIGNEAGFFYFLKETIGIVGFCVMTTICLWVAIMKYGIKLLTRINNSDKRVRNVLWLLLLLIGLIIFQGLLIRKVTYISHINREKVKIMPQKSKIVVAKKPEDSRFVIYLRPVNRKLQKWKSDTTQMWINSKERCYKMWLGSKERTLKMWINNKQRCYKIWINTKENSYKIWIDTKKHSHNAWLACKDNTYKMKNKVISTWPFNYNNRRKAKLSYWESMKERFCKIKASIIIQFKSSPFNWNSKLTSKYKTGKCSCPKKQVCKKDNNDWKFWSNWQVGTPWTGWFSSCCQLKVKSIESTTKTKNTKDQKAHDVMKQSKLYAIPMEMKRPPQLLVTLRNYFQR